MFYRLSPRYALRSWEQAGAVLLQRPEHRLIGVKPAEFRLLLLCDGVTDFADLPLGGPEKDLLEGFVKRGVVQERTNPLPLERGQSWVSYQNRCVHSVLWSITGKCNYRCRHCYMDAPGAALGELSHEDAMKIIGEMAACGVPKVDITGGEPLIRGDFWALVDALLDRGIGIGQIYTNGWLVDEKLLGQFMARGIRPEFSMSFDGVGWHDWMRGVEGAEKAALRAMRLCAAGGFPVSVEMCVHKGNAHTLRDTVKALSEAGVSRIKCGPVSETALWKKNCEGNAYSLREYCDDMLAYIPQFYEDGCPIDLMLGGVIDMCRRTGKFRVLAERYDGSEESGKCYLCGSVRAHVYITADGRLLPCMPMTACKEQELFAKVTDIGLRKGLSDSFFMEFVDRRVSDLIKANEKCGTCPHVLKCGGGCRAAALEKTGDLMGADEGVCMMWNEGYVDRIRQAAEQAVQRFCPGGERNEPKAG